MSVTVTLAEAVKEHVNAGSGDYPEPVAATRAWIPIRELKDLKDITVTVAPRSDENAPVARATYHYDYQVDIGIQKQLGSDATQHDTEIDALNDLVEAIEDRFLKTPELAGVSNVVGFVSIERPAALLREHFLKHRLFSTLVTVTYRIAR